MALNFPNSPVVGTLYNGSNGTEYRYDGEKWTALGSYLAGPNPDFDFVNVTGDTMSGSLGIGALTSGPTNQLHVYDDGPANDRAEVKIESFRPAIRFQDDSAGKASAEIVTDNNSLRFRVSIPVDDDTTLTEHMSLSDTGVATVNGGIKPSATSTVLDEFEEGTFTPVFSGTASAGTYTYSSQAGTYTKVGDAVHVAVSLGNITAGTVGSGAISITGLPFVSRDVNGLFHIGAVKTDNFTYSSDTTYVIARIVNNASDVQLRQIRSSVADSAVDITARDSDGSDLYITLTYFV